MTAYQPSRASAVTLRAALATACAGLVLGAGLLVPEPLEAKVQTRNAEDLLIVDCLLPGQVRKLGRQATFMSARRPVRTTQADCEIRGGEYVSVDRANYQTALKVWMDQALGGDVAAQNYVGEIYLKGLGTAPDYSMARSWFEKAAAQGSNRAKMNLGFLYEQGLGVDKDLAKALNLYREASGIQDELLFASAVELQMKAKDAEISTLRIENTELRSQLEERRRELQSSQQSLRSTEQKLAQARQAVGAESSKLDAARQQLANQQSAIDQQSSQLMAQQQAALARAAKAEQELASLKAREQQLANQPAKKVEFDQVRATAASTAATLADAQAKSGTISKEIAANEQKLAAERAAFDAKLAAAKAASGADKGEDWELMRVLENQLLTQQSLVSQAKAQVASLESQVGSGVAGLVASVVPKLQIFDPAISVTRGKPAAMLRGGAGVRPLSGQVSSPQGLQALTINGVPVEYDKSGRFATKIDVAAAGSLVEIAAVDATGTPASLEFMMIPQGGSTTAPTDEVRVGTLPSGVKLGNYHAIVIGNNRYSGGYSPLATAVNDATAVSKLLRERYGYKTTLLTDANRFDILSALNEKRESLGPDDNLLVYYAGHGELAGKDGYWVPVDGRESAPDSWISNAAISSILETMKAKHVLVVADSCYSGALTGSAVATFDKSVMPPAKWAEWVKTMAGGKSRMALTSGGVQPVLDAGVGNHSYFARALLGALRDNGGLLEGQQLYRSISTSLALAAADAPISQVPQYAPIQFAGHESGEYFFAAKGGGGAGRSAID